MTATVGGRRKSGDKRKPPAKCETLRGVRYPAAVQTNLEPMGKKAKPQFVNRDAALEKAIEALDSRGGRSFDVLFNDFMETALGMLCNNPSEHQRGLLQKTFSDETRKAAFLEALKAYGEAAEGYHDPLGEMFMLRISHGQNGQFFTPEHVCEFMAAIMEPHGETLNDPCCGSGRLMLAGLKIAREGGNEPIIFANDLSYTCSQMCLMNLLFNSARGEVSCGDALRMDVANFRYFHIDRVMMPDGRWMSTYWQFTLADVDEVDRKREAWKEELLSHGILFEIVRHDDPKTAKSVPEDAEIVPSEDDSVPESDDSVPKEEQYDHLTATPKAVQLELDLF